MMIDMSLLRGVQVDPASARGAREPGCLLGDVDRETQAHGLAAVLGFVSATGCAGLTLGGGFGYLTRRFGWTSDNLASVDLVTADGRVVRASEQENADLFWGLCGGGGNFGVATAFEYKLQPVGPDVVAGAIAWRGEEAAGVLDLYRSHRDAGAARADLRGRAAPGAAGTLARQGRPRQADRRASSCAIRDRWRTPNGCWRRSRRSAARSATSFSSGPYVSQQALLDATQPKGRRYYWKSEYLRSFEPRSSRGRSSTRRGSCRRTRRS